MSHSHDEVAASTLSAYSQAYWKFCTIALGIALMISLAVNAAGPVSASAAPTPEPAPTTEPALRQLQARQTLAIGGFDTIDGAPAFVILDEQGRRLGRLPMNAASSNNP